MIQIYIYNRIKVKSLKLNKKFNKKYLVNKQKILIKIMIQKKN